MHRRSLCLLLALAMLLLLGGCQSNRTAAYCQFAESALRCRATWTVNGADYAGEIYLSPLSANGRNIRICYTAPQGMAGMVLQYSEGKAMLSLDDMEQPLGKTEADAMLTVFSLLRPSNIEHAVLRSEGDLRLLCFVGDGANYTVQLGAQNEICAVRYQADGLTWQLCLTEVGA